MPKAITASTQDHLPIEDIIDDIVILKNGSAALVIQTTAVNFGLLSEKEQDATIFAYGALLNSLSHSVQILIRSKRTDISQYLDQLTSAYQKQTNPALKSQIGKYIEFVKTTIQKGKVLDKKFYLVIPFSILELGAAKAAGVLTKGKKGLPFSKEYITEQAKINLYPKKDLILKQLTRLGLKGQVLTQPELVELYFDIYNPAATGAQKITAEAKSYTAPIIQAAIESQAVKISNLPTPEMKTAADIAGLDAYKLKEDGQSLPAEKNLQLKTKQPLKQEVAAQQSQTQPTQEDPETKDSEKILRELQALVEKTKSDLVGTTEAAPVEKKDRDSERTKFTKGQKGEK